MSTSTFAVKPLGIIEPFFNDDATTQCGKLKKNPIKIFRKIGFFFY